MKLKAVLETLEGLPEALKASYTEKDGKFYLDIEGVDEHPSVGALKRAKDHEKALRQAADEAKRAAEDRANAAETTVEELRTGAIPKSDVEALKASYTTKAAAQQAAYDAKFSVLQSQVERTLLDSTALRVAAEISTVPELIMPLIRGRLKLDEQDGQLTVAIVDAAGKPSAATLDDLKKEVLQNRQFAPILIGSKAHGGGASGGSGGGGASTKKLVDMNESERTSFAKDDPAGFRRALAEAKTTAAAPR